MKSLALVTLGLAMAAAAAGCDGAASARTDGGAKSSAANQDDAATSNAAAAPAARPTGPPVEATFDDLKFPMELEDPFDESLLTDRVRTLFDKRIRIRGYIYPTPRKSGLKQLVLVRDNMECCFGPGAALFDCIVVTMVEGVTADFS
ncbi:MAG TPA: hypothetical protein PKC18_13685, partial [Lacipirellulaceae bacterium]|nr:hypothetical protein [Lacipirellulaceae bacterium]